MAAYCRRPQASPVHLATTGILGVLPHRIAPVSYTHLDVYKRQSLHCATINHANVIEIAPVSYTHLDVYKRQADATAEAPADANAAPAADANAAPVDAAATPADAQKAADAAETAATSAEAKK